MTQVILHIGMHKTGSSSIQETLAGFDDGRTRYARLGPQANHSLAVLRMFGRPGRLPEPDARRNLSADEVAARTARLRAALRRQLAEGGQLILSAEAFSALPPRGVTRLARFLDRHGATGVQVVGYARAPLSFAASALQQQIRNDVARLTVPRPEYRHRFAKFLETFGADAVQILPFDRTRLTGGSVVTDFLTRCGIDPARLPERRANETMNAGATRLAFAFNRSGIAGHGSVSRVDARMALLRALRMADTGAPFALPGELIAHAHDAADVAWLRKATGIDFTVPDLPEPLPAAEVSARLAAELALQPGDLDMLHGLVRARGLALPADAPLPQVWAALYESFLAEADRARARPALPVAGGAVSQGA